MIILFEYFKMQGKQKKINILKFNEIYSNREVLIKIPIRINRQLTLKEVKFIIDKIYYREGDIYNINRDKRTDALIISLKTKLKSEIQITKTEVLFESEFERTYSITQYDDTIQTIVDIYRSL